MIEAKRSGETVEKAEPAAGPTGVVDLMEALRAGERAGSPKATGGKATASGKPREEARGEEADPLRAEGRPERPVEGRPLQEGSRSPRPRPLAHEP
ncbi:hypothetical protein OG756_02510 [Streptomyces sp. NBC_01310]|uniref:hypothetical protein n=1 Tax=Streptomyces sp. NBC_01310 TaxID=2903820 RepID=UPI0035B61B9D|nr:hypothetical protein OG756_02510 [Streptomyces sp. NBC_01310]